MIGSSVERIGKMVGEDAFVLDVGGWAKPFRRADVVLDQMPYATRGLYGADGDGPERFDETSWVRLDICDHTPWPFPDDAFDFAVCSHTLEDVRDPVWVCAELSRVARAGYVEVPSRLEEQSYGVQGAWVGWGHHHWLVDVGADGLQFVFKHHVLHGMEAARFPYEFYAGLSESERVQSLWWEGELHGAERTFVDAGGLDAYLASFVAAAMAERGFTPPSPGRAGVARRLRRTTRRHGAQPGGGRPASAASTGIPEGVGS